MSEVIQKVAAATPENLEALEKELEECLKEHLEAERSPTQRSPPAVTPCFCQDTGSQKDHMKSESDKCLDQAKKRIEMLNEAWAFAHRRTHPTLHCFFYLYIYIYIYIYADRVGRRSARRRKRRRPTRRSGRKWSSVPRTVCSDESTILSFPLLVLLLHCVSPLPSTAGALV